MLIKPSANGIFHITTSNYEKHAYDGLMNYDDNSGGAKYNSGINSSHEFLLFQLHVLFDS
jgi:hypothetical protein